MELSKKMFLSNSVTLRMVFLCIFISVFCQSSAKRFDCRMFCKETGFHGMVGGCRCSFTLFTAKRAIRDPQEIFDIYNRYKMNKLMSHPEEDGAISNQINGMHEKEGINPKFRGIPNIALTQNGDHDSEHATVYRSKTPASSAMINKRSELEQDLDNGDTGDYLRLAY